MHAFTDLLRPRTGLQAVRAVALRHGRPCVLWAALLQLPTAPAQVPATDGSITAGTTGTTSATGSATATPPDDPLAQLRWERDFTASCVTRQGVQILVRNAHPERTLRVWLERWHMGRPTGDRSRSDLRPGAPGEPLGCSRTDSGEQSWKPVRAQFVD